MARAFRQKRRFIHTAPIKNGPYGMTAEALEQISCECALIVRLDRTEFGVFMNGRWSTYTIAQWSTTFDMPHPASLEVGWYCLVNCLWFFNRNRYVDRFTTKSLEAALERGLTDLHSMVTSRRGKITIVPGLNVGDRQTVSV